MQNNQPRHIADIEGVSEYIFDNGFKLLLLPDESQSTVTVNITYLVGSRHEGRGEAGMAHLLEHMLFKGTPKNPDIKGALQQRGAFFNASTWYDRTNYYETLPASHESLRFALELEADRMLNSFIKEEDLAKEMTVVRNEFEMVENDPTRVLMDQIMSAAYRWHNYGKTTIGNRSDIERVPAENLRVFYKNYYQPDNAVLVVAGKFDSKTTLDLIAELFGSISKPVRLLDATYTEEPAQDGPRLVNLQRVGDVAAAAVAYHVPQGSHSDFAAINILVDILSEEPHGLAYKTLVESGLSSDIMGMGFALHDPGMLLFFSRPTSNGDVHKVCETMCNLFENIDPALITEENIARAKSKALKYFKLTTANSKSFAMALSESIAQGAWQLYFRNRNDTKAVTREDVLRVAKAYLIESNRTAGIFVPTPSPLRILIPKQALADLSFKDLGAHSDVTQGEAFDATTDNIEERTVRKRLCPVGDNGGIEVAFLAKRTRGDVVRARLIFRMGSEATLKGRHQVQSLLPQILMRGTTKHDHQALRDRLDELESTLDLHGSMGAVVADIVSDKKHLGSVMELLAEILKEAAFDEKEFFIVKKKKIADLEELLSDPQKLGSVAIDRMRWPHPKDHILYVPTVEERLSALKDVTLNDLKALYHSIYGASCLHAAFVGSFDDHECSAVLQSHFGSWVSPSPYKRIERPYIRCQETEETVLTPDKEMAFISMATNFPMRDDDPDYGVIDFANYIFGESMKSRIMWRVREQEGLSYSAGSYLDMSRHDKSASMTMYAICAPQNANRALLCIEEEFKRWVQDGLTPEELSEGKASFKQTFDNMLARDSFVLDSLARHIDIGRTFAYYDTLLARIDAITNDDVKRVLSIFKDAPLVSVRAGSF
jgi:zinc protease